VSTRAFTGDRGVRLRVAGAARPLPTIATIDVSRRASLAELITAGLVNGTKTFVDHDPMVRRDEDPEGVHGARVGVRRVRSVLRLFAGVLDPAWAQGLDDELARVGAGLGVVRDADVLTARLETAVDALADPADRVAAVALLRLLAGERRRAVQALMRELDSNRYHDFVVRLVQDVHQPVFAERFVDEPARAGAAEQVRGPWDQLRREVKQLPDDPQIEQLHRVRIRAKRVRFACEGVAPVIGKPARRLAKAAAGLQGVLGDLHDAALAEAWLRRAATVTAVPRHSVLVAGELIAREEAEAAALTDQWPAAWRAVRAAAAHPWLGA
jgi:CHAD domain-containing protein